MNTASKLTGHNSRCWCSLPHPQWSCGWCCPCSPGAWGDAGADGTIPLPDSDPPNSLHDFHPENEIQKLNTPSFFGNPSFLMKMMLMMMTVMLIMMTMTTLMTMMVMMMTMTQWLWSCIAHISRAPYKLNFFKFSRLPSTSMWSVYSETSIHHYNIHLIHYWLIIFVLLFVFYIALFSDLEQTHCAHVTCDSERVPVAFHSMFLNIHWSGVLTAALSGCCTAGTIWNCCRLCESSVRNIQPCTSSQCHFIQSHIGRVQVCLAVTCRLHFGQNDRDLLHTTAV